MAMFGIPSSFISIKTLLLAQEVIALEMDASVDAHVNVGSRYRWLSLDGVWIVGSIFIYKVLKTIRKNKNEIKRNYNNKIQIHRKNTNIFIKYRVCILLQNTYKLCVCIFFKKYRVCILFFLQVVSDTKQFNFSCIFFYPYSFDSHTFTLDVFS